MRTKVSKAGNRGTMLVKVRGLMPKSPLVSPSTLAASINQSNGYNSSDDDI